MLTLKQFIAEALKWELPPAPGTHPIPDDHVRLYHQTKPKNLGAIKHQGIKIQHAKGYEGPKAIWADEKGFYGKPDEFHTVEFHVHKSRWNRPFVDGDVKPHEIIAIHKPWHKRAKQWEKDDKIKSNIVSGKHDDLLGDDYYGKAVRFIKKKYKTLKEVKDDYRLMTHNWSEHDHELWKDRKYLRPAIKNTKTGEIHIGKVGETHKHLIIQHKVHFINGREEGFWHAKQKQFHKSAIDTSDLMTPIQRMRAFNTF